MSKSPPNIADCIEKNLAQYFYDLEGQQAHDVYNMVLVQVEKPMLQFIMRKSLNNQSKASAMLGINRNTLRKKLIQHGLLNEDSPSET